MRAGKVEKYILDTVARDGGMLFAVIDPADHPSAEVAAKRGIAAAEAGSDVVLVSGSTMVQGELLDDTVKQIKEKSSVPVVIFPGNISMICKHADAFYFHRVLNSRNPYWITGVHTLGAPVLKRYGVEPLPVGYIVVEYGTTVGWVSDANFVPDNKPQIAAALALGGEYSGSRIIVLDKGSSPPTGPVKTEMIKAVRAVIDPLMPLVSAGGIRTTKQAGEAILAGADAIQVGTIFEEGGNTRKLAEGFVKAVKSAGKRKV
ncbi:geranylgeranylglyceryl/heptaprenylglyceryl phosphate synthase [Candidatus Micrarchaeota archaeon]|nr:geranylgeranylglyceryl/heptaprenylglyceryl phosphate synthase [Candidatus Micrarchaeota archaeon]